MEYTDKTGLKVRLHSSYFGHEAPLSGRGCLVSEKEMSEMMVVTVKEVILIR